MTWSKPTPIDKTTRTIEEDSRYILIDFYLETSMRISTIRSLEVQYMAEFVQSERSSTTYRPDRFYVLLRKI